MVKLYVNEEKDNLEVKGSIEGTDPDVLTQLTIGVRDLLNQTSNPEKSKKAFLRVINLILR